MKLSEDAINKLQELHTDNMSLFTENYKWKKKIRNNIKQMKWHSKKKQNKTKQNHLNELLENVKAKKIQVKKRKIFQHTDKDLFMQGSN